MKLLPTPLRRYVFALVLVFILGSRSHAASYTWNLENLGYITNVNDAGPGLAQAITAAKNHFTANPNDQITLKFNSKTYTFIGSGIAISLAGVNPGPSGKLIIKGSGPANTTLVMQRDHVAIDGRFISHVRFEGLRFTRAAETVSQGVVTAAGPGYVKLQITSGFPTPADIYNAASGQGRYLRRYLNAGTTNPQIDTNPNNAQIPWNAYTNEGGGVWKISFNNSNQISSYQNGETIGIKSKHGGDTYFFTGCDDLSFDNIHWTRKTRGVLRGGTSDVLFNNIKLLRVTINGVTTCLASPGGGPQMNQPADTAANNCTVQYLVAHGTGDDCIAFFNVDSGSINNNSLYDSFARGVYIDPTAGVGVSLANNLYVRAPLEDNR